MIEASGQSEAFRGTSRFSILRRLGSGGMGIVYLARDHERDRDIALKVLPSVDAAGIYRFKQEFRSLAGVAHKNLVELGELIADDDQWFFTMEYVEGADFLRYVHGGRAAQVVDSPVVVFQSHDRPTVGACPAVNNITEVQAKVPSVANADTVAAGPDDLDRASPAPSSLTHPPTVPDPPALDLARLRDALVQLVHGVSAVHAAGFLHLDIKPSNVLVTAEGRVVVLDFGLATEMQRRRRERSDDARAISGTPGYMAPEQAAGLPITEASDWYGVGALLYQVLTGSLPFNGTAAEIMVAKMTSEPPPPDPARLGIPAETCALCADLLRLEPRQRPLAAEILARLGAESTTVRGSQIARKAATVHLVGRERPLAALREAFDASKRGAAVTVAVHGSSGMGKSAVVDVFLDEIVERGEALVLSGRCYERESVPYKAFDSLVDMLARHLKRVARLPALLPSQLAALARLFPVLGEVPAIGAALRDSPVSPDPQELRRQAFAALRELFDRLAAMRPVVLFIDDVQWGDLDSAALLSAVLRSPDPPKILVVACYRTEQVRTSPFLVSLRRELANGSLGLPREIAIQPLAAEESRALALTILPDTDVDRDTKAEIVARESAGHPYFVAELAHYLSGRDAVAATGGTSLDEMIWDRVLELPAEVRGLLEMAAIAGRPVSMALARRALASESLSASAEDHAVNVLQARSMIRTSGALASGTVETFHDRVRESVASRLPRERLREWHARLASALEATGSEDVEQLVVHLEGAEEREKAGAYAAVAADAAARALAFDRAAMLYQKALRLLPPGPRAAATPGRPARPEEQTLRERLADALANAGRGADAGPAYLEAAAGASGTRALDLRRRAAEQLLISGHTDAGTEALRSVIGATGMRIARSPLRALPSILVQRAVIRARGLRHRERTRAAIPEDTITQIDICWAAAVGLSMVDNIRAADFQARHLLLALRAGEPSRVARAVAFEMGFVAGPGSAATKASAKLARRAERLAGRVDTPYARSFLVLMEGVTDYLGGRFRSCLSRCEAAEVDLRERCSGVLWELTSAQRFSLGSLMYMGRIAELSRRAPLLLRRAQDLGNLYAATDLRTRFTLTWLAADDPARAQEEVDEALESWSHEGFHLQHYNSLLAQVQRDLYVGDAQRAWRRIDEAWLSLRASMLLRLQLLRTEVVHLRARVALALAAHGRDTRKWLRVAERDAARIERERAPWADPLAVLVRAAIASARGRSRDAVRLTGRAARGFDIADMALHAAVARRCKGELLGGVEGRGLVSGADEWMRGEGVVKPDRIATLLAPGRWTA